MSLSDNLDPKVLNEMDGPCHMGTKKKPEPPAAAIETYSFSHQIGDKAYEYTFEFYRGEDPRQKALPRCWW